MNNESRTKSSIKNISFSMITQISTILLNYICRYIFVRTLSEEYLGVNGLFTNILTIFSLAELGIGSAIIYAMYKPIAENNENKIKAYMNFYKRCYNIIALIILFAGLMIMPFLKFFINDGANVDIPNLYFIYFLYLLDSVFSYLYIYKSSILNAMQKNYICNRYQIICKILMTIFMCFSLIVFKNFIIYLIIQILFKLFTNILISNKADKMYPFIKDTKGSKLKSFERKNIFKNVYALFCNQIGSVLINGTDNIIISKYISLISVGLYSNYYLIISSVSNFVGQMFNAIVASVGNLSVSTNKENTLNLFHKINFINFVISFFCLIMLVCCLNDFIGLSFGAKYILDNTTVIVLLLNFYFLSMRNVVGTFKYAMGIFWNDKYSMLIRAIINVVLSIVFVKKVGLAGVFLGTLVSDLVTTFWYQPFALFKYGFDSKVSDYFKDFLKYGLVSLIGVILCVLIINQVDLPLNIVTLIFDIIFGVGIFIVIMIILFRKNEYYKFYKNMVFEYIEKLRLKFKGYRF